MRTMVLAVLAAALLGVGCSGGGGGDPAPGPPAPTAMRLVAGAEALVCTSPIDALTAPPEEFEIVAGVVALETGRTLQAGPSGETDPAYALFAKTGLLIRADAQFELSVPDDWADRAGLRWGNVAGEPITAHLQITGCRSGSAQWLVYPGGFYVVASACVPVIVTTGATSRTVAVSVGAPCPGVPGLAPPA